MKNVLLSSILLGVSVLLAILAGEGMVRILFPEFGPTEGPRQAFRPEIGVVLPDPDQQARMRAPSGDFDVQVQTNSLGLRDSKALDSIQPGDWLALGDSFTFGYGVEAEHRYSNQLEQATGLRVFNLAASANDLRGYGRLLQHFSEYTLRSKQLIVGICMENDLRNYHAPRSAPRRPSTGNPWRQALGKFKLFLLQHSALYHAFVRASFSSPSLMRAFEKAGLVDADDGTQANRHSPELIQSAVQQALSLAKEHAVHFLIIPSRRIWRGDNQAEERRIHQDFVDAMRFQNQQVVDMLPVLEGQAEPLNFYFPNDGHWNAQGHALAALTLCEALDLPCQPRPAEAGL